MLKMSGSLEEKMLIYRLMEPYKEEYGFDYKTFPFDWFYSTDDAANYSFVLPFELNFSRPRFMIYTHHAWILSLVMSAVYIILVFGGQRIMSYREKPFELRQPLIIWNWAMAVFSAAGLIRTSHELFGRLVAYGFQYTVCMADFGKDPVMAFWTAAFVASKFVELLDTAFLVLRKKPLMFLHWYHHVTVLVFSWHTAKGVTAAGRWYAWMNYGAHSFMYAYYAIRAMHYRPPRGVSIFVTSLQLSQMLMGVIISYTAFRSKYDWKLMCHQTWANLGFAVAIYVSYFVLFAKYFHDAYLKPKAAKIVCNGAARGGEIRRKKGE